MPAGKFSKNPNYESDSAAYAEEKLKERQKWQEGALHNIYANLDKAVNRINTLMELPEEISEDRARSAKIQFQAASALLTFGGLKVEKVEHSGKVNFEPLIIERGDSE